MPSWCRCVVVCLLIQVMLIRGYAQESAREGPTFHAVGTLYLSGGQFSYDYFKDYLGSSMTPTRSTIPWSLAGGVGLAYGPIPIIGQTSLTISSEVSYSEIHVDEAAVSEGTACAIWRRLPIMVWGSYSTENELTPFVRVGLGAAHIGYQEIYTNIPFNLDFHQWGFAWGGGAGIEYRLGTGIHLGIILESITMLGSTYATRESGSSQDVAVYRSIVQLGIRSQFSL
jgi:opacity protein-like surface antigen